MSLCYCSGNWQADENLGTSEKSETCGETTSAVESSGGRLARMIILLLGIETCKSEQMKKTISLELSRPQCKWF